jgi:flagellar FliJ protein
MFQFRLEPLIKIRDNVLKECQAELAKAYDARRILEEHLQEVERQLTEGTETARSLMQPGQTVNVDYLLGIRRQEMFLLARQDEIKQKMQEVDEEIERRRDAVVAANKELKILEKLKEKRHEQYLDEEKREETKAMNEIAGRSQNPKRPQR